MGRERRQHPKPLKRRVAFREPRKTLTVFCEGQRTEPEYLEALKRDPEVRDVAAVDIRVETRNKGSLPLALVRMAIDARERALREEGEVDEFWCVFDVEWPKNHPGLQEALTLARENDIKLAVSNPCFELWLALHFKDHRSFLNNDQARRLRRSHDGQLDKGLAGSVYMARKQEAAQRASALEKLHARNGMDFPNDNPSSGMHLLIATVTAQPRTAG
ncbi:RloB family protein [Micromonospora sonneratiae]